MHSNEHEVLQQALNWHAAGQRCVLVTVLRTFGASPRPPGAMAVISEQGLITGSVSGGCVEDDLVHEVTSGTLWREQAEGEPRVLMRVYGRDAAERERYRLPCGNALRLAVEPFWDVAQAEQALQAIRAQQLVCKHLDYASGLATLAPAQDARDFSDDEHSFSAILGPRHRLLIIGATEVSRYLLPIAQSLGYAVSICDPRSEYTGAWQVSGQEHGATLLAGMPDDVVMAFGCDERTAVVTVTHDPKLDDLALMEALRTPAFYVGALGSSITTARRKARLKQFDLSDDQVGQLRGPVGLPIGSRSPAEIAVSIAAELIQVRRLLETGEDPFAGRHAQPAWMPAQGLQPACTLDATASRLTLADAAATIGSSAST
ncbi:MAG: XdhC family protein [Aquabacterium sp.]|uniref:XdhC family protein n=1 Tax=Aquabacterium sp. TaxID=1872578 RepID=UPI001208865F|nr:XdhC family protein [Aquabacterium sp.]TAL00038.1 MAG: XdhC family protein [Aquabacterium sp.]